MAMNLAHKFLKIIPPQTIKILFYEVPDFHPDFLDSQVLEEALKLVGEQYESELCGVIRTMLRRNFKQRPGALELKEMQYVNHCIALSKSKPGDVGVSNGIEGTDAMSLNNYLKCEGSLPLKCIFSSNLQ